MWKMDAVVLKTYMTVNALTSDREDWSPPSGNRDQREQFDFVITDRQ